MIAVLSGNILVAFKYFCELLRVCVAELLSA